MSKNLAVGDKVLLPCRVIQLGSRRTFDLIEVEMLAPARKKGKPATIFVRAEQVLRMPDPETIVAPGEP